MTAKVSFIAVALAALMGCASNRAPDVAGDIRNSLKQAGLNDVSVSQDRDKGVVTLAGNVNQDARQNSRRTDREAAGQGTGVADEIAVLPKEPSRRRRP